MITQERISEVAGVWLAGIAPDRLDAAALAAVKNAFDKYHMVLLRGLELEADHCVRLSEAVGGKAKIRTQKRGQDTDQTMMVSNVHKDGHLPAGELLFHTDGMFFQRPLRAISLYAIEVPNVGGETMFANSRAAYQNLPSRLKDRIAKLQARHIWDYSSDYGNERPDPDRFKPEMYHAIHPLAWPHPDSGEMVLYASKMFTDAIIGLPRKESDELLEELFTYIEDPSVRYTHKWKVGDFLLWDNRAFQHARTDFDPNERRALLRVPIAEEVD